jgi:hypothetical protein
MLVHCWHAVEPVDFCEILQLQIYSFIQLNAEILRTELSVAVYLETLWKSEGNWNHTIHLSQKSIYFGWENRVTQE